MPSREEASDEGFPETLFRGVDALSANVSLNSLGDDGVIAIPLNERGEPLQVFVGDEPSDFHGAPREV